MGPISLKISEGYLFFDEKSWQFDMTASFFLWLLFTANVIYLRCNYTQLGMDNYYYR